VTPEEVSRAMGEIDLLFSHSLPAECYFLEGSFLKKTTSLATKATTTTTSTVREPKFWGHVLVSVTRRTNISHGDFLLHSLTPSHPLPTLFTAYHKPDTI